MDITEFTKICENAQNLQEERLYVDGRLCHVVSYRDYSRTYDSDWCKDSEYVSNSMNFDALLEVILAVTNDFRFTDYLKLQKMVKHSDFYDHDYYYKKEGEYMYFDIPELYEFFKQAGYISG